MGDNKDLKDISLTIYGLKKTIKGLSESTTCDDVIETVFDTLAISIVYASSFGIFESSLRKERFLPGRTRVLKLIRSWGTDNDKFELIMKRVDNITQDTDNVVETTGVAKQLSRSSNERAVLPPQSCEIDRGTLMHQDNKPKLKRATGFTSIQTCRIGSVTERIVDVDSNSTTTTEETGGKMYILKKYMNDVRVYADMWGMVSTPCLTPRAPADGSDYDSSRLQNARHQTSKRELGENIRTPQTNRIRNSGYHTLDAELIKTIRTPGDGEYSNSTFNEHLNDAFLCSDPFGMCETPRKDTSGLNEAFIVTGEDCFHGEKNMEISDDSPNDSESLESYNSQNQLLRDARTTVYDKYMGSSDVPANCEMVKHILETASSGTPSASSSEDSLIESFMNTKLHEDKCVRQYL